MSLANNSANNFKDFLDAIKPYLNYQFYDMSGQGVEANNFSTDEKVIGTWIDGKPLYQKTVNFATSSGWTAFAHSIANVDTIFITEGFVKNSSGTARLLGGSTGNSDLFAAVEKTNINIYNSDSAYTSAAVTLRYTKTTDTEVASGEKIVGQWIDGKPVFEKVITDTFPTSTGSTRTDKEIDITSINIDLLISLNAIIDADGTPPISAYIGTGIDITGNVYYTSNKLTLRNQKQQNYNGAATYIILRYTKSS